MEIEQAKNEVTSIGIAYFYDDLDRYTVDEIVNRIVREISQATKLEGICYSETSRDAFFTVVKELDDEKLDRILFYDYGLLPEDVGGSSRAFFQRLANEMDKAIREVKPKLAE